jgi:iron complex outermembrane receptor protein
LTNVDHLMHDEFRESSQPSMMVTRDYMMETDANTTVTGVNLSGKLDVGPGSLRTGIDGFRRKWDATNRSAMYQDYAKQPMIPDVYNDQFGLFAEYSQPLSDTVIIKGGLRLDYAKSDAHDLDQARLEALYQPYQGGSLDNDNDFFEPTVNLQMFWQPSDGLELSVGLASASRMPDPQELYIGLQRIPTMMAPTLTNWVGNPALDPVRNNQADLGIKLSGDTFILNGSVFYSRLDDYIYVVDVTDPDGPTVGTLPAATTYRNIDAELWGGELSGQVSLPWDLYLSTTLAYTEGENRDTDEPLAEIPPLSGSIALRYDVDSWFVELQERFAARQDRVDDSLNEEETAGWGVTDLKAGLNLDRWSMYAGVDNLFDKDYFNHLSYVRNPFRTGARVPETGAFAYLTVMYRY